MNQLKKNLLIQGIIALIFYLCLSPILGFTMKNWGLSLVGAFIISLLITPNK